MPGFSPNRRGWSREPFVLFVEGYGDLVFYAEFLKHLHFQEGSFFIQDLRGHGRNKLEDQASLVLKPDNLETIRYAGVIVDADSDAEAAFQSVRDALRQALSTNIPGLGEWVAKPGSELKVGIFIAGGLDKVGEVESLAWSAWSAQPHHQDLKHCVERFIACAKSSNHPIQSEDKVRIGAALSVLNEDDPRLGPGARAGLFPFEAPEFEGLRRFFDEPRQHLARQPNSGG